MANFNDLPEMMIPEVVGLVGSKGLQKFESLLKIWLKDLKIPLFRSHKNQETPTNLTCLFLEPPHRG